MNRRINKIFLILAITLCLALTACRELSGISHAVMEETDSAAALSPAPSLPKLDFDVMDFFDDGYETVEYSRTTDGDTASFIMGGLNLKCRFVGVDTPEIGRDGAKSEPFAEAARDYTQSALENASVIILERDEKAGEYDNYDRLLAHVWVDGRLLSFNLIAEGLATARYFREDYKYFAEVSEAEAAAKDDALGVWGK